MKPTNAIANSQNQNVKFSTAITSSGMQAMIAKAVPDARAAARLTGTLISIVNSSEKLQKCDYTTIVTAALRGEGEGLILGHGYYVVPYGNVAQYQRSYKGYIALAMSTGYYADIDCVDVREGELTGLDPRKCKPSIDFSKYGSFEEREKHKVIGYYAYFELKDGMFRYEYWNIDKILRHADKYAPAFKLDTYRKLMDGKLSPDEISKLRNGSPWYDIGGGQEDMMKKTVLRRLLNSGYAPLSNEVRLKMEDENEGSGDDAPIIRVDEKTGEYIESTGVVVDEQPLAENNAAEKPAEAPVSEDAPKRKRTRQTAENAVSATETANDAAQKDFTQGFFG